jgi:membrane protease YdiL (CAAX protease family)
MSYLRATVHPWASLLFVLPLLALYEGGVRYLSPADPDALRNGADAWVRWFLARYGLGTLWAAPAAVAVWLVARAYWNRKDRPEEPLAVCFGMAVESVLFAAGLWAAARNFAPVLERSGLPLNAALVDNPAAGRLVTFVGAGIYEEVLFRVLAFGGLCAGLRLVLMPKVLAVGVAAAAAAVLFASAHHFGAAGEPVRPAEFLFRVTAGLYFTLLYLLRGFGIAVGAHAGYDILVGLGDR